jgi:hypothetical protein
MQTQQAAAACSLIHLTRCRAAARAFIAITAQTRAPQPHAPPPICNHHSLSAHWFCTLARPTAFRRAGKALTRSLIRWPEQGIVVRLVGTGCAAAGSSRANWSMRKLENGGFTNKPVPNNSVSQKLPGACSDVFCANSACKRPTGPLLARSKRHAAPDKRADVPLDEHTTRRERQQQTTRFTSTNAGAL